MVIDLTLDGLKVPALTGYETKIGTVVKETAENKGRLTAAEVADNIAMPWIRSRPIQVDSDCTLGRADYDARIMAVTPGITITLGSASYVGCTITVYACFEDGADVTVKKGNDTALSVSSSSSVAFLWNGTEFVLSPSSSGGQGATSSPFEIQPYENGETSWDIYDDPPMTTNDFLNRGVIPCGNVTVAGILDTFNYASVTGVLVDGNNCDDENMLVIKVKLNNITYPHKKFFLLVKATVPSSVSNVKGETVYIAQGLNPPDENGKFFGVQYNLGSSSYGGWIKSCQKDMFNNMNLFQKTLDSRAGTYTAYAWVPFNFTIIPPDWDWEKDAYPIGIPFDKDGFVYIKITSTANNINIAGWGIADCKDGFLITPGFALNEFFKERAILSLPIFSNCASLCRFTLENKKYEEFLIPVDEKFVKEHRDVIIGFSCAGDVPFLKITTRYTGREVHLRSFGNKISISTTIQWEDLGAILPWEEAIRNMKDHFSIALCIDNSKGNSSFGFAFFAVWSKLI